MSRELIYKDDALNLIAEARKPAERNYQGERREYLLKGLRIASDLVTSVPAVATEEDKDNA